MKKIIVILFTTLLIYSCTSTKQIMGSWLGKTKKELIMNWGPPSRTSSDGDGGKILVYAKQIYMPAQSGIATPGANGTVNTGPGTPARTYWQYKMFFINSDNLIYHWLVQQQQVPPQQIDLNLYIK